MKEEFFWVSCLWACFWRALTWEGRHSQNVGGTNSGSDFPAWTERNALSTSVNLSVSWLQRRCHATAPSLPSWEVIRNEGFRAVPSLFQPWLQSALLLGNRLKLPFGGFKPEMPNFSLKWSKYEKKQPERSRLHNQNVANGQAQECCYLPSAAWANTQVKHQCFTRGHGWAPSPRILRHPQDF